MADDPNLTAAQNDNLALLNGWLGDFGLGELGPKVKDWVTKSYSADRIKLELQADPVFTKAFPEYEAAIKAGNPMTPADILHYRTAVTKTLKDAGLPSGFYDSTDDFVDLVTKGLAVPEIQARIHDGFTKVQMAPPEVKQVFQDYFGVAGDGALASFYLDPEKGQPLLQKMTNEAIIGGTGKQYGFNIDQASAAGFAEAGVSQGQAQQGFQQAFQMKPLAEETMSEQGDLTNEQLAKSQLTGGDAEAQVRRRQQERSAQFKSAYGGQGGGVQGQRGIGIGGAPST